MSFLLARVLCGPLFLSSLALQGWIYFLMIVVFLSLRIESVLRGSGKTLGGLQSGASLPWLVVADGGLVAAFGGA